MPPKPPFSSWDSFQTLHVSPTDRAMRWASRAISAGGMSPAGVFTRSRAQCTASTTIPARFAAAESGRAGHVGSPSTTTFRSPPRSLASPFVR